MKTIKLVLLLCALLGHASCSLAEDTDIYSGLGGAAGIPNVLIIIDNAANFEANTDATCTYSDAPSTVVNMAGKLAGLEQCALNNVIDALPTNSDGTARVNIGMMVYGATGIASAFPSANCASSNNGGCLISPLSPMTAANKTALKALIKGWTIGNIKANGEGTALAMQEAWAYYAGATGASGRSYSAVKPAAGCQKNFVIFLGNAYNNVGSPGDGGSPSELLGTAGATAAQQASITIPYAHGAACNTSNPYYSMPNHTDPSGLYADEWSRFMHQADLYSDLEGAENITTYTIAALGAACKADYPALLASMARHGGGKYFPVSADASEDIVQAFLKILNEVQAVNSVFSASSLPVSVNAQGTYLNQIYMGMFRPDETGAPRWLGNMKQYSFVATRNPDTHLIDLSLGDSLSDAAISSGGTGFISPNSVSYWTCGGNPSVRVCSPVADPAGGFWVNHPQSAGGAYDLPDGELVEKGGAAQVMRLANLTADYTTTVGLSTNPRKLYTYCPSGASCNTALTHASNAFATTNADITATMFGSSSSLIVSSIVRTGNTALVTTSEAHGFADGSSVTISGATQSEYNVTQNITTPSSATTFTITGLPNKPTTPSVGAYTVSLHNAAAQGISSITRNETVTNSATATATTTAAAHGYNNGDSVIITGAPPSDYHGIKTIATSGPTSNQFTYSVPVYPTTPALNSYKAVVHPYSRSISSITKVSNDGLVTTTAAHGFHVGQSVTIAGTGEATYNGAKTITVVGTTTTFKFSGVTGNPGAITAGASVIPSTTPVALGGVGSLTRTGTTAAATATATGATASAFANGDTLDITVNTGDIANESAYVVSGALITCSGTCTTFTYPITTTPALSASGAMEVALSVGSVNIPASSITRIGSGTTATVTGVVNGFASGNSVDISTLNPVYADESAYTGTWTIACAALGCNPFTFGPVPLSPTTQATTGSSMRVYQGSTPPDKDPLIKWVRGEDNVGDEESLCPLGSTAGVGNCPNPRVTVRPSFHGDVLHSRPVAINYGGTTGVVVFYGANDGVYRAVNGNQANPAGSSLPVPGSELWGFIPTDFFSKLNRQRNNSPLLQMPSTPSGIIPTPEKKDYFADGSTSVYQLLNADGTTDNAYIYLAMRRGGDFIYALDVSNPTTPTFLWKIEPSGLTTPGGFTASTDFAELGETWSAPKVARIKGYNDGSGNAKPVMIFGGGYSTTQDEGYDSTGVNFTASPSADTRGRGIFIVDAETGALVWRATYDVASDCSDVGTEPATCTVLGMNYGIPADITLMDRDNDGYIDRLYAVDVGGNVWRVDLQREGSTTHNTPDYWKVNQVASLGGGGVPLRKFFYPPDVLPTNAFDAVIAGSGDREHPLSSTATRDRIFVLKDLPGNDGSGLTTIVPGHLFDATSVAYAPAAAGSGGSPTPNKGYFKDKLAGEKIVNAPLTVAGYTYYGTNQPSASDSCSANLGIAKGYRLDPLTGTETFTVYDGGGLPPSPVAGVVIVTVTGEATQSTVPFCIGCGGDTSCVGADCESALGGAKPTINVPTSRTRTYWYREVD